MVVEQSREAFLGVPSWIYCVRRKMREISTNKMLSFDMERELGISSLLGFVTHYNWVGRYFHGILSVHYNVNIFYYKIRFTSHISTSTRLIYQFLFSQYLFKLLNTGHSQPGLDNFPLDLSVIPNQTKLPSDNIGSMY